MLVKAKPWPLRPWAGYHYEMLRWYDHWLKGMDTRVMEGPPIQLYIHGDDAWRSENEWPLKRTQWREFYLGSPEWPGGNAIKVCRHRTGHADRFRVQRAEGYHGEPRFPYRTKADGHRDGADRTLWRCVCKPLRPASDTDWLVLVAG